MARQTYPYDAFISYSHKDESWVSESLLKRLQGAGVEYAWDRKDFLPGKRFESEMLRLMRESKHTVIVLTREWLRSNFTDFEYQLSRAMDPKARESRVLILNVDNSEIPKHLAHITSVNVPALGENDGLRKLVDYIVRSKEGKRELASIWGDFTLWKELPSNPGGGYQYAGKLTVGNPAGPTVEFDSILISTHVPEDAQGQPHTATAVKIIFTQRGMSLNYSYSSPPQFQTADETECRPVMLESGHGISLPELDFGPLRGSRAGSEPVICSISLFRGSNQISGSNWCVLPPVARLSPTSLRGPSRFDSAPGFEVQLLPEKYLSPKTGILDQDILDVIFTTAGTFAQDSLLERVRPETITVISMHGGEQLHTAAGWKFQFFSESKGGIFEIAPDDPSWVDPASLRKSAQKPQCWLSENLLNACWLDAAYAYLLALPICASAESNGGLMLETVILDGVWRPVWHVPRSFEGRPAGVLADCGEIIVFEGSNVRKPQGIIWNS